MIIAKITSGLGNQLFQYALARHLSIKNKTPLYFDLGFYDLNNPNNTARKFKLDHFSIKYRTVSRSAGIYWPKATKIFPDRSCSPFFVWITEQHHHFDTTVLSTRAGCITLQGYWQSEKYFDSVTDIIRHELTFKDNADETFNSYKKMIQSSNVSVSVHVRRGDYVHHPEFSKTFGFVGLDYYSKATDLIQAKFENPVFFIFSDDTEWVNEQLGFIPGAVFVENRGADSDINDLHLMSLCRHNIIANSSYSWWGGWLNNNPDKVVIAPQCWYKNKPELNTKDMVPAAWIKL